MTKEELNKEAIELGLDRKRLLTENHNLRVKIFNLEADKKELTEQLSIAVVMFSEAELKVKLEEQKEEIRQWLIGEDFEGLAERL